MKLNKSNEPRMFPIRRLGQSDVFKHEKHFDTAILGVVSF